MLLGVGRGVEALPLSAPPSLLQQRASGVCEDAHLPVLDALQPVAKGSANAGVHGVGPEGLAGEERAHLNAQLPDANGDA